MKNKKFLLSEKRLIFFGGPENPGHNPEPNDPEQDDLFGDLLQAQKEHQEELNRIRNEAKARRERNENDDRENERDPDQQLEEALQALELEEISTEEASKIINKIFSQVDENGVIPEQEKELEIHKRINIDLGDGRTLNNVAIISMSQNLVDDFNTRGEKALKDIAHMIEPAPNAIIFIGLKDQVNQNQGNIVIFQATNNAMGLGYFDVSQKNTQIAIEKAINDINLE